MELLIVIGCVHLTQRVIRLIRLRDVLPLDLWPDRSLGSVFFALALEDGISMTATVARTDAGLMPVLCLECRGTFRCHVTTTEMGRQTLRCIGMVSGIFFAPRMGASQR